MKYGVTWSSVVSFGKVYHHGVGESQILGHIHVAPIKVLFEQILWIICVAEVVGILLHASIGR